jgi:hypothetical protein
MGWFDPFNGTQITTPILNHYVNYGWEYVWHCHILAHEEMDMMHSMVFAVPPKAPSGLSGTLLNNPTRVRLNWVDNSATETGFTIQRARNAGFTTGLVTLGTVGSGITTYSDTTIQNNTQYYYRVMANNRVGDTQIYNGIVNAGGATFETMTADSTASNTANIIVAASVSTPGSLRLMLNTNPRQGVLTWTDTSNNETSFRVWRSGNGGVFQVLVTITRSGAETTSTGGTVTYTDTAQSFGTTYAYYIIAYSATNASLPSNTVSMANIPVAPTGLVAPAFTGPTRIRLQWTDASNNETSFVIYRSVNGGAFTQRTSISRTAAQSTSVGGLQTWTDTSVTAGTQYRYYVRAANATGWSIPTNTTTTTP